MHKLTLAELKHHNILVLGAGMTGMSCVRFLHKQHVYCTLNDSRSAPVDPIDFALSYPQCVLHVGQWNTTAISEATLIVASPGIDLSAPAIAANISDECIVIGDIELYCQLNTGPIIAVTGSNGKSTVVSLLHHIAVGLGKNAELVGNIGTPILDQMGISHDVLVLELSSFQLETLSSMHALSASVLNLSDDHLDRHKTMDNYQQIKQKIYQQCEVSVFNRDDRLTVPQFTQTEKSVISFGRDEPKQGHFGLKTIENTKWLMFGEKALIATNALPLSGEHNAMNFLAALALGLAAGWSLKEMVATLPSFVGLPHRCQSLVTDDGLHWINDSKATNVGATISAIEGLSNSATNHQLILIAGGEGKGADFSPLNDTITQKVDHLITLGKDGDKIIDRKSNAIHCSSIEQAVEHARSIAKTGDIILLSPACASIDMFKYYVERGNTFVKSVFSTLEAKV